MFPVLWKVETIRMVTSPLRNHFMNWCDVRGSFADYVGEFYSCCTTHTREDHLYHPRYGCYRMLVTTATMQQLIESPGTFPVNSSYRQTTLRPLAKGIKILHVHFHEFYQQQMTTSTLQETVHLKSFHYSMIRPELKKLNLHEVGLKCDHYLE